MQKSDAPSIQIFYDKKIDEIHLNEIFGLGPVFFQQKNIALQSPHVRTPCTAKPIPEKILQAPTNLLAKLP
jgi:hypothetical protein